MKLNKDTVKQFENEQKEFGTKIALYNIIFLVATDILKDLGVKSIKTK